MDANLSTGKNLKHHGTMAANFSHPSLFFSSYYRNKSGPVYLININVGPLCCCMYVGNIDLSVVVGDCALPAAALAELHQYVRLMYRYMYNGEAFFTSWQTTK